MIRCEMCRRDPTPAWSRTCAETEKTLVKIMKVPCRKSFRCRQGARVRDRQRQRLASGSLDRRPPGPGAETFAFVSCVP